MEINSFDDGFNEAGAVRPRKYETAVDNIREAYGASMRPGL